MFRKTAVLLSALAIFFVLAGHASAQREFFGAVEAMPESGYVGEWIISGRTVKVTSATEMDFRGGAPQVGQVVKVHGQEVDGVYVAREIKTRTKDRGRGRGRN